MKANELEQTGEGLSYQEKSIIITLISSILVYAVFSILTWQRFQAGGFSADANSQFLLSTLVDGAGNLTGEGLYAATRTNFDSGTVFQFWGRAVLLLIGVQIILGIIGQIVLHVAHAAAAKLDDIPTRTDERDKLIDLKATRNTFVAFGVGFMLSMIGLAVGMTPVLMPVIMLVSMMAAEIVGNLSKLYFYRRGY